MAARAIDDIGVFLPPPARDLLGKAVEMLESNDLHIDEFLRMMLGVGESVIEQGLDATVGSLELLVEKIYAGGVMEKLGDVNPFIRDGAEIGIQISLNTLKAMTAGDVAKIVGLVVIAVALPNLLLLNGPEFLSMAVELGSKLWNLP